MNDKNCPMDMTGSLGYQTVEIVPLSSSASWDGDDETKLARDETIFALDAKIRKRGGDKAVP